MMAPDVNENGIKAIGLDSWQNSNFARIPRFFVHFFTVTARLRLENVLSRTWTHARQRLSYSCSELRYSLLESTKRNAKI